MTQTILVLIIIALSIIYSVYALVRNVRKKETSACGDCNGCDIKSEITKNLSQKATKNPETCGCAVKE